MERRNHDDNLLMFCTHGAGETWFGRQHHHIHAGELLLLPRGQAHSYQASTQNPWTLYWFHFDGLHSDLMMDRLQQLAEGPVLKTGLQAKLLSDFGSLMSLRDGGYQLDNFIYASNHIAQMLSFIALVIRPRLKLKSGSYLDLDRIHSLMQENLHQHLDLDTIAASVSLSKYHFSKKYKELTGYSPIQHFIHLKMQQACYQLDISDKSIQEVAAQLGYDDAYYFSRLFSKILGVSPSQYRAHKHR
ncbi:AraC family transcriptional regulator [Aestuariirhabdus sp. Z084]|nr:AraC family transcriptional regulator [Aestuariirhabdus haliotis]MCL6421206.1 AraC family transcriptional regulator [Aestuariirhabdus haliotis]